MHPSEALVQTVSGTDVFHPESSVEIASPDSSQPQRHVFVDNIRFWSILSVVAVHCAYLVTESGPYTRGLREILAAPWKFGTIGFFLISGFLLGEGLERRDPREYMARRLRRVFVPWLIWYIVGVVVLLAEDILHHRVNITLHLSSLHVVVHTAVYCLFDTAYWFVPNMFFALSILLLFRRYLLDRRFLAVLIGINLFYAVNVYTRWIPSKHTAALFGFILYYWLGNYAARHSRELTQWAQRRSWWTLPALTLLTGAIAFGEGRLLHHLQAPDPLNAMRLSAQIFSVVATLMLFQFRTSIHPRLIDVRAHTFGVYLLHPIVLVILVERIRVILDRFPPNELMAMLVLRVALWVCAAILTCAICFTVTKLLAMSPSLGWLVGAPPAVAPKLNPVPPATLATDSLVEGTGRA